MAVGGTAGRRQTILDPGGCQWCYLLAVEAQRRMVTRQRSVSISRACVDRCSRTGEREGEMLWAYESQHQGTSQQSRAVAGA